MAGEETERSPVSISLPPDVDDWLANVADRYDESREETCRRLLLAAHAVATDDADAIDPDVLSSLPDAADLDTLAADSDLRELETDLQTDIEDAREEFQDLLEDVRDRVIQVKRETDAKAPAAHDHSSYADQDDLESVQGTVEAIDRRLDAGFENFEEVLEHLLERADEVESRATVLASAVLDLRERQETLLERERRRARVESLKLAANRLGVSSAACEECGESVDVALLTEPECPTCASTIADVEPKSGFFGSPTLVTGDPPALEGHARSVAAEGPSDALEAVAAETADDDEVTGGFRGAETGGD
ncbi:hypothetical protein [Natrarchaeobaculum aegyptiacum]|uniref:CopG family transcriptional regulator n=1 Tax=Natrarchaeobaculum aegyptiacum TaxID=745377 RepID=A0A2Z2HUH4_9EURY|nr:hypothetical protein [Natrarchaeobaculum aegyptiacum]ARS90832.1 hypothetical protein B1756_14610 [Natrarchaeobaculum aegyptiacum]